MTRRAGILTTGRVGAVANRCDASGRIGPFRHTSPCQFDVPSRWLASPFRTFATDPPLRSQHAPNLFDIPNPLHRSVSTHPAIPSRLTSSSLLNPIRHPPPYPCHFDGPYRDKSRRRDMPPHSLAFRRSNTYRVDSTHPIRNCIYRSDITVPARFNSTPLPTSTGTLSLQLTITVHKPVRHATSYRPNTFRRALLCLTLATNRTTPEPHFVTIRTLPILGDPPFRGPNDTTHLTHSQLFDLSTLLPSSLSDVPRSVDRTSQTNRTRPARRSIPSHSDTTI